MNAKDRIILALDVNDVNKAVELVNVLKNEVGYFKIGLELITHLVVYLATDVRPDIGVVEKLFDFTKRRLFWDGKWNDIPNTVTGAAKAIQPIIPKFINIHASAGVEAMKAAVANRGKALVLAVTVLTSLGELESASIFGSKEGYKAASYNVIKFAKMALEAETQGIICSPQELGLLSGEEFSKLIKVVPGVRPAWAVVGDQKRVMTPGEAVEAGADYLVIGRPITQPPANIGTPVDAARRIVEEIA